MPALTMRGRYLMREYWTDSDLFLRLNPQERELYIGLWMLSDDAGWMPRDIPAISAALYRYEDRAPREALVTSAINRLRDLGKIEGHRCCLFLPAVARYPRAGKKSTEHHAEHQLHLKRNKSIQTDLNPSPVPSLPVPSLPDVAPTRPPESGARRGLGDALLAAGMKPEIAGKLS